MITQLNIGYFDKFHFPICKLSNVSDVAVTRRNNCWTWYQNRKKRRIKIVKKTGKRNEVQKGI